MNPKPPPAPASASAIAQAARAESPRLAPPVPRRLDSDEVFRGATEVLIRHAGTDYRLRRTGLGKLILTK